MRPHPALWLRATQLGGVCHRGHTAQSQATGKELSGTACSVLHSRDMGHRELMDFWSQPLTSSAGK